MSGGDYPVPDAVFEQHSAWLATSGAGKTTAVKGGVERMLARGERVVIVDPTGVWWGLRFMRDGRRASPHKIVIFGREHADLPLEEGSAEAIARALGSSSTSAILSLRGMRVAERTRFITAFFEALESANKGLLNLVIDEIHLFAPQNGGTGLTPAMLHATNNLVSLGRSAGLRIAMISQRPAKVHKDSLTQATALVALRCSHNLDQRPGRDWLATTVGYKAERLEIMLARAGLLTGDGWLSAPQLGIMRRVSFPMIATFDSSKPGVTEIPLKPLDVGALRAALAAPSVSPSRDRAENRSEPPPGRSASASEISEAEQRGREAGYSEGYADGRDEGRRVSIAELEGLVETMRSGLPAAMPAGSPAPPDPRRECPAEHRETGSKPTAVARAAGSAPSDLTAPQRRVLEALAWWRGAGHGRVPRARAAIVAGYSPRASTHGVLVGELVKLGLVKTGGGTIGLTDAGVERVAVPRFAGWEELRQTARSQLDPQPARVFDVVCAAMPDPIRRDAVAEALGLSPKASTAGVYIGKVSALGLIEPAGAGHVRAAPWLFGMGGGQP